ncbi:MAG: DUF1360 domain-containing protein [Candidatus Electrothrix sp. AR4]|nr:DUF1360 domain-containing protein [Candidatus Electrothrix sp. AR4]
MDPPLHAAPCSPLQQRLLTDQRENQLIEKVILLSLVTASISFTVSEAKLFKPFRAWMKAKNAFMGELVSCGYCLGHWVAMALVLIYQVNLFSAWPPLDYFLTALVIAWLSGFQWVLMCWLMERAGK